METNTIFVILWLLIICSWAGCDKKSKGIFIEIETAHTATLKTGQLYYISMELTHGDGQIEFKEKQIPSNSKIVKIKDKSYLKWKPKKEQKFIVIIQNLDENFQQEIWLEVVK